MRRLYGIGAALGFALASVTAGASAGSAKTLTFLTERLPPFNYGEQMDVKGPSRAIIGAVCQRLDANCRFELLPKKRMMHRARKGEADGLFSLGKNAARKEWMYFSKPLLQTEYGFFVRAGDDMAYKSPADLAGYRVVTYGPSNMAKSLRTLVETESPGVADVTLDTDLRLSFRKLVGGRYGDKAAVFSNRDVGRYLLRDEAIEGVRYAGAQRRLTYHVGFPKKAVSRDFVERFDAALTALRDQGRVPEILARHGLEAAQLAR